VVALILIVIGLLATFGVFRGGGGSSSAPSLDRTDPNAVAAAFLQRYAVHDPSVCGLVAPSLQPRFTSDGRCSGLAGGAATVTVITKAIVCGNRAGYAAQVSPPGQLGKPYASVGLELDGTTWSVRSLLPLSDRSVIQPYNCASSGNYGG
jgi:hypothetical protein